MYQKVLQTLPSYLSNSARCFILEFVVIEHVDIQSCLLIIFQHKPISLQYIWLSVGQPIRYRPSFVYAWLEISNKIEDKSNVNMPY